MHEFTDDDKCTEGCVVSLRGGYQHMVDDFPTKCWYPPRHVKFDGINALMPRDPDCVLDLSEKYSPTSGNDKSSWHVSNGYHSVPDAALKPYPSDHPNG
jgi:hypothetical protein